MGPSLHHLSYLCLGKPGVTQTSPATHTPEHSTCHNRTPCTCVTRHKRGWEHHRTLGDLPLCVRQRGTHAVND